MPAYGPMFLLTFEMRVYFTWYGRVHVGNMHTVYEGINWLIDGIYEDWGRRERVV